MSHKTVRSTWVAVLISSAGAAGLVAQSPRGEPANSAPSHQHYVQSALANQAAPNGQLAPRLQNLGTHVFPVSTGRPDAQLYINQGVNLSYAFNHAEAGRSFREAARLDPDLAMAYWGQALVLGPNINAPMNPDDEGSALRLVQEARSRTDAATAKERALIDALSKRYTGDPADRQANDRAYALATRDVHERFPEDMDISMLYVEAVMDLRPWQYWTPDGQPYDGIAEIVELTEGVLEKNPRHPLALHLYIHLMEPTSAPERAEPAADTLLTLMPAAGHIATCLRTYTSGSDATRIRSAATSSPSRPTRTTSHSAARKASTRWGTTRTIFTSCGSRPRLTARVAGQSRRPERWRQGRRCGAQADVHACRLSRRPVLGADTIRPMGGDVA